MHMLFAILVAAAVLLLWVTVATTRHIRQVLRQQRPAAARAATPGRPQLARSALKTTV